MRATFLIFLCFLGLQTALGQSASERRANVELIAERDAVQPGETFFVAFDMQMVDGWHVYWRNPGDVGLPPMIEEWRSGQQMAGEFIWPAAYELPIIPGKIMDYGFKDRLVLPFPVTVPDTASGLISVSGILTYLICETVCIQEKAEFQLALPVSTETQINEGNGALIADWIGRSPQPLNGEARLTETTGNWTLSIASSAFILPDLKLRFFPYEDEIVHAAEQVVEFGADGASVRLIPFEGEPFPERLEGVLVAETPAGIRTSVEISAVSGPLLSGTSGTPPTTTAQRGSAQLISIVLLALLGGVVLNLMPCVLPVLAIKAVGFVESASNGSAAEIRLHGVFYTVGVLFSFVGIAATFVVLRAGGEFLSLGFQLQYPIGVAFLALLMFCIGLWLLGVFELGSSVQGVGSSLAARRGAVGAFFTGVLAAVVGAPCIGPFLGVALGAVISEPAPIVFLVFGTVGFGLALPILLLSYIPGLQRYLPKPGQWMNTLKQFFAFPMFLTAAWLLSVLSDQAGGSAVVWTVAGAVAIGFAIWIARLSTAKNRTLLGSISGVLLLLGFAAPLWMTWQIDPLSEVRLETADAGRNETWSPERLDEIMLSGKGALIDFTASWCATCQLNKITTLQNEDLQQTLRESGIVFMVADFTNRDEVIAEELRKRGRPGVPMYLLYLPGQTEPKILPQILSKDLILREIQNV
ncbi:MAG: protein-disulfide reductase DsbD domain-containing protein [Pseudomonadota bacterium]